VTRQQVRIDQYQQDLAFKNSQIERLLQDQSKPIPEPIMQRHGNDQNLEI
jgi:hypothetical protein